MKRKKTLHFFFIFPRKNHKDLTKTSVPFLVETKTRVLWTHSVPSPESALRHERSYHGLGYRSTRRASSIPPSAEKTSRTARINLFSKFQKISRFPHHRSFLKKVFPQPANAFLFLFSPKQYLSIKLNTGFATNLLDTLVPQNKYSELPNETVWPSAYSPRPSTRPRETNLLAKKESMCEHS